MTRNNHYTLDDYLRAVKELRHERMLASCDFYPNRREALDLAIKVLLERAEDLNRME